MPKPTTVNRPPGLAVTTVASPVLQIPAAVTSFVVLSLKLAVTVNCDVSPIDVSVRLPLTESAVGLGGGAVGVVGAVGVGVRFSPPQPVHAGERRSSSTTPILCLEYRRALMRDRGDDLNDVQPTTNLQNKNCRK